MSEYPEWMKRFAESIEKRDGRLVVNMPPRRDSSHAIDVALGAFREVMGKNWDVLASDPEQAQRVRREAREMAARLTDASWPV